MIPVMVVPVLKFYDRLQAMLDTVDYPIGHIIIFDNGGQLKSAECSFAKRLSIVSLPDNLGVPTTWNLGIKLEPFAKYWLFSQDDIVWVPGGLQKIDDTSSSDNICVAMKEQRPFSSFTVGENVIERVGLFDESYYPLVGDDFNFHKRCHFYGIEESDISGCFIAEKSASIKELAKSGKMSFSTFKDNFNRSVFGPPTISKWSLFRRRNQESFEQCDDKDEFIAALDSKYIFHNKLESSGFDSNLEVTLCDSCGSSLRQ